MSKWFYIKKVLIGTLILIAIVVICFLYNNLIIADGGGVVAPIDYLETEQDVTEYVQLIAQSSDKELLELEENGVRLYEKDLESLKKINREFSYWNIIIPIRNITPFTVHGNKLEVDNFDMVSDCFIMSRDYILGERGALEKFKRGKISFSLYFDKEKYSEEEALEKIRKLKLRVNYSVDYLGDFQKVLDCKDMDKISLKEIGDFE